MQHIKGKFKAALSKTPESYVLIAIVLVADDLRVVWLVWL